MKICLISRSCLSVVHRRKLRDLAKFDDIGLTLVTPGHWRHMLGDKPLERAQDGIDNYEIISLPISFNGNYFMYFYRSLGEVLRSRKPDIVHIEDEPPYLSTFQIIYLCRRHIPKAKILFFTWENIYKPYRFPFSFFEKYVLSRADYAVCGNEEARGVLVKKGFKKETAVIPQSGIDPYFFAPQDVNELKNNLGLDFFTIGYIGRLTEAKGLSVLLEAAAGLNGDFRLLIIGKGDYKERLVEQARQLGILGKLVFCGAVSYNMVPAYLNCLDVLVLPSMTTSVWKEQFGHILIEAMSCKVPVIGSDSGEIPNVIGDSGLIFKEGDRGDLRAKIEKLMDDSMLRITLAEKGRTRALENYTHERICRRYYEIYKRLFA